jgi:hypothetical protein
MSVLLAFMWVAGWSFAIRKIENRSYGLAHVASWAAVVPAILVDRAPELGGAAATFAATYLLIEHGRLCERGYTR